MEKLGMTYLEDTEYTKFDGSETFKAQTFFRKFLISCGKFKYRRNDIPVYSPAFHCIRSFFDVFCFSEHEKLQCPQQAKAHTKTADDS